MSLQRIQHLAGIKLNEDVQVTEKAPKGWEGTVKAMKKHPEIDNPWALAWSMKNKGYKSHKKEESVDVWGESAIEESEMSPMQLAQMFGKDVVAHVMYSPASQSSHSALDGKMYVIRDMGDNRYMVSKSTATECSMEEE